MCKLVTEVQYFRRLHEKYEFFRWRSVRQETAYIRALSLPLFCTKVTIKTTIPFSDIKIKIGIPVSIFF